MKEFKIKLNSFKKSQKDLLKRHRFLSKRNRNNFDNISLDNKIDTLILIKSNEVLKNFK